METTPNKEPRYTRFLSYGLGRHSYRSHEFERRSKRSFRKWSRRLNKIDKNVGGENYDLR